MSAEGDETRAKILQYVVAYEGINLSGIIRGLGLGNNQANHHLRVLESAGQVWSTRDGRLLRYYSTAVSPHTPPESLPKPPHIYAPDGTPIQLLDLLARLVRAPVDGLSGNLTQAELAEALGVSQQTISYHLASLQSSGYVVPTQASARKQWHVTPAGMNLLASSR